MRKIAVIYWSGTGNTAAMADAVADGVRSAGGEPEVISADVFDTGSMSQYDAFALGCPAMGMEVLEETVFEPMLSSIEGMLSGKKVGLFGSYGWGDGTWMRNFEDRVKEDGAMLVDDGVIANGYPDGDALAACNTLGSMLA